MSGQPASMPLYQLTQSHQLRPIHYTITAQAHLSTYTITVPRSTARTAPATSSGVRRNTNSDLPPAALFPDLFAASQPHRNCVRGIMHSYHAKYEQDPGVFAHNQLKCKFINPSTITTDTQISQTQTISLPYFLLLTSFFSLPLALTALSSPSTPASAVNGFSTFSPSSLLSSSSSSSSPPCPNSLTLE